LKKRTKKLFSVKVRKRMLPHAQGKMDKSFLLLFFKKEVLLLASHIVIKRDDQAIGRLGRRQERLGQHAPSLSLAPLNRPARAVP